MIKIEINKVYNTDALIFLEDILNEFGEKSIDMFLCDFPYTYEKKRRVTANKWDTPIDIDRFFELSKKLLKDTGVIALTATNPFASYLVNKGIEMYKYDWVWEKDNGTNFVSVKHQPFKVHEMVLIFGKAPTTYNKKGIYLNYEPQFTYSNPYIIERDLSNVTNLSGFNGRWGTENKDGRRYPRSVQKFNSERGLHPTQKPTKLFEYLIKTHCPKDGIVVDVCCGSGTTGVACINTERNFIINDLNEEYFKISKERCSKTYTSTL